MRYNNNNMMVGRVEKGDQIIADGLATKEYC